jgi:hypothetical protein
MGLRFSILGFAQERVLEVKALDGNKELRLDVTDLLLLNQIADFPNRNTSMKIIEDDKLFFWMAYSEILSELPILNMKKQALRDRFDKLVTLGLLEKKMGRVSNMTFFRLTDKYESLKYDTIVYDTERGCVVNNQGVYSDTQGVCSQLHTISEYKYNNIKEKEIYKEKEKYGEFKNVLLTDEEYHKLEQANLLPYIEKLSSYIASKGKKYKSHYATILTWSRGDKKNEKPLPEWFDKDIDKEQINKEDEEYINNLLDEFK